MRDLISGDKDEEIDGQGTTAIRQQNAIHNQARTLAY